MILGNVAAMTAFLRRIRRFRTKQPVLTVHFAEVAYLAQRSGDLASDVLVNRHTRGQVAADHHEQHKNDDNREEDTFD